MTGMMRRALALAAALGALAIAAPAAADLASVMIDVSSNQELGAVIAGARQSGAELVMHRATLGIGTPDKHFREAAAAVRSSHLAFGAYHVLYPMTSPDDTARSGRGQAREFLAEVAKACRQNEPVLLAVDWEAPKGAVAASPQQVEDFILEVRALSRASVLVYTDRATLRKYDGLISPVITQSPLWFVSYHRLLRYDRDSSSIAIANQDEDAITIELKRKRYDGLALPTFDDYAPWERLTFWQFSEGGESGADPAWPNIRKIEPDITGFDTNYFFGARTEFRAFFKANAWKCDRHIAEHWFGNGRGETSNE